jgi:hypothetical protein
VDERHLSRDDRGTVITFQEKNFSKCKPFKLFKGQTETLTLEVDLDSFDAHPILKDEIKNLKKYPDYLVFCRNKKVSSQIFVLIVELKSENKGDWHRQAKAGVTISKYLIGMLENYLKRRFANVQYRCLLFHKKGGTARMHKKKKIKNKSFSYDIHPIFDYKFSDRPCQAHHELEMLLR